MLTQCAWQYGESKAKFVEGIENPVYSAAPEGWDANRFLQLEGPQEQPHAGPSSIAPAQEWSSVDWNAQFGRAASPQGSARFDGRSARLDRPDARDVVPAVPPVYIPVAPSSDSELEHEPESSTPTPRTPPKKEVDKKQPTYEEAVKFWQEQQEKVDTLKAQLEADEEKKRKKKLLPPKPPQILAPVPAHYNEVRAPFGAKMVQQTTEPDVNVPGYVCGTRVDRDGQPFRWRLLTFADFKFGGEYDVSNLNYPNTLNPNDLVERALTGMLYGIHKAVKGNYTTGPTNPLAIATISRLVNERHRLVQRPVDPETGMPLPWDVVINKEGVLEGDLGGYFLQAGIQIGDQIRRLSWHSTGIGHRVPAFFDRYLMGMDPRTGTLLDWHSRKMLDEGATGM